jgi:hypothetical protein
VEKQARRIQEKTGLGEDDKAKKVPSGNSIKTDFL